MNAFSRPREFAPPGRSPPASLTQLLRQVAEERGISAADLKGRARAPAIAAARQIFMARAYATGRFSLPQIGRFLKRHHTTILYGVRTHAGKEERGFAPASPQRLEQIANNDPARDARGAGIPSRGPQSECGGRGFEQ